MPVSKKRKKDGKPVQRHAAGAEHAEGAGHPEEHAGHPALKANKPKNPFVAHQPVVRSSQRGR